MRENLLYWHVSVNHWFLLRFIYTKYCTDHSLLVFSFVVCLSCVMCQWMSTLIIIFKNNFHKPAWCYTFCQICHVHFILQKKITNIHLPRTLNVVGPETVCWNQQTHVALRDKIKLVFYTDVLCTNQESRCRMLNKSEDQHVLLHTFCQHHAEHNPKKNDII